MVIAKHRTYVGRMRPEDILAPTREGVCCKPGGFHIDPTRPVERALITHGHSDHARAGHGKVLATQETLDIMRLRYGENFAGSTQAIRYGETLTLDGAKVAFHPAGHVLGSAQISVECKNFRVVASGDYKNVPDPTCAPFELVPCDVFITEATFGLPVFRHPAPEHEIAKLLHSVALFPDRAHLVGAYGLGKAQRLIALLRAAGYREPIYLHGAMETITRYYESRGIELGPLELVRGTDKAKLGGKIIICPPSSLGDLWSRRFPDPGAAFASGWMRVRARARQHGVTLPLVLSDHADWDGLTATITATGASEVWVTHGQEDALVHWCTNRGLRARPLDIVGYGDEEEHEAAADADDGEDAQRIPLPPRALASGGEGSGVGGSLSNHEAAAPTPNPSPPLAAPMGGGGKKVVPPSSRPRPGGNEESGDE
jgi:putative mRNA 3-end processing factor